jgi:predicted XRE-type DNA-binding protein
VDEAMTTMTNASPSARGRRAKFTPRAFEKIKVLVAQGFSREEIASLLGVTVGSLQVTCSRLGISLRRKILHSGPTPHLRDPNGRAIPVQGSVGVAYAREQKTEEAPQKVVSTASSAKIAIMMRRRGKEVSTDVPLTSRDIGELALIAMLRDLSIAELVGQALGGAIKKNMIENILRDDVPSSSV